jgi:cysteinyl-tRNA synthetase
MLQIYNTLTSQKEIFKPLDPRKVGMYVCGVTVYDYCHLGHARTYIAADMIVRYLRALGYAVRYVRNITDIDDKIIKRALENQEAESLLTQRFTQAMHADFAVLGLTPPDEEPRATDYIPQIIHLITQIIENGHGYVGQNGDVYFDVRRFSEYGCLSHHDIEQLESGARIEISEVKRDPLDFVLWKQAKPNEPAWDSPWGKGRPGWHAECSAMAMQLLGAHFDIHAGGRDLIFPHHENEIAQSQSASREKFVNYWVHAGFLQIEKEKMSKSLGNFITIREALKEHAPEVLRFFMIASHYRSPLIYTEDALYQARQSLARLYTALRFLPQAERPAHSPFEGQFMAAMDDDFNTPIALSVLFDLAHEIQRLRNQDLAEAAVHGALLQYLGDILGVLQTSPDVFFQTDPSTNPEKIKLLISARQQARQNINWVEADRIRNELAKLSVAIEDGPQGTTWKVIK